MDMIVHLIEDRAAWLRTMKTDQWVRPWPSRIERDERVQAHIDAGKTWIVWNTDTAAATITIDPDADPHWPAPERRVPAVYIHRLVVSQPYAGAQLGAQLLDWAGRTARRDHGGQWIRANVWTTNQRLHEYYARLGFRRCERDDDTGIEDNYPSAALFQRPTSQVMVKGRVLFTEAAPGSGQLPWAPGRPTVASCLPGQAAWALEMVALPRTVSPS
jgi:GNAT superfamily N-acetyltransferase